VASFSVTLSTAFPPAMCVCGPRSNFHGYGSGGMVPAHQMVEVAGTRVIYFENTRVAANGDFRLTATGASRMALVFNIRTTAAGGVRTTA